MKTRKAQAQSDSVAAVAAEDAANESQSVDRIRDIIFGAQMRDYDSRFSQLEDRMARSMDDLREKTESQLKALADRLGVELKSEANRRTDSGKKLAQQLKEAEASLSKDLSDTAKQLHKEIERLSRHVEKRLDQLAESKTDRAALANLLAGLAERLSSDGASQKK